VVPWWVGVYRPGVCVVLFVWGCVVQCCAVGVGCGRALAPGVEALQAGSACSQPGSKEAKPSCIPCTDAQDLDVA